LRKAYAELEALKPANPPREDKPANEAKTPANEKP
jgi:hypothetical protein